MAVICLFTPFLHSSLWQARHSLALYFHTFYFNASIYFLLRAVDHYFLEAALAKYLGAILATLGMSCAVLVSWIAARKWSMAPTVLSRIKPLMLIPPYILGICV